MATLLSSLQAINAYPIPQSFIETAAVNRGLDLTAEVTTGALLTREYCLTKADVLLWLSEAPNISQGGQNYSLDTDMRSRFRSRAYSLYEMYEQEDNAPKTIFGYKGSRL